MSTQFRSDKPIFVQVREQIEDQIVNNQLKEGEQAPSTNQLVQFYKINHATISKGVTQLVDEGILYKKRGVGMFVAEGAKQKLVQKRKQAFMNDYVIGLVQEAEKLLITEDEIIDLIKKARKGDKA
ncbi:GntR family transcriptional regulator [Oceanobacillus oncorhynchi subsp. incaldanensis]|uniref:HTH-type transcriptional repressor YtrA n=2 Tax=Oceanobacillus TaxID=182709 RepID=A0A0A1MTJ4_9BACI|nr:GntR family transcriptional regulator [Oceanobacillus oncorhynchi]MDM8100347.1 GntR family transcriptional regulator [Oceanobacillus oncorhynchi]UUI40840.1 GntR family transcriptional regulator [Oceanobacillus oncorhynchi]GIO18702.1 GntR family transcriptional regulator [Oceanobacillus oncorhynchi subsp. incaldanensis]CEI82276.1 HTH-type transcriptional repressor YtrA [Oceanobacillus oncorhynchi]